MFFKFDLKNIVFYLLVFGLVVAIGYVILLFFKQYGIREYFHVKALVQKRQIQNEVLIVHNQNLNQLAQTFLLPGYVEGQARENLGMMKQDERYYLFSTTTFNP